MAISSEQKCGICRFSCKSDVYKTFCKFYPKKEYLGYPIHFKDPDESSLPNTSRVCVVCKKRLNYRKTHWKREIEGWYSMCKECAKDTLFLASCLENGGGGYIDMEKSNFKGDSQGDKGEFERKDWHKWVYGGFKNPNR